MAHPPRILLASLAWLALLACSDGFDSETAARPASLEASPDVLVHVDGLGLDALDTPVVVLREEDGDRSLPILIGPAEATSIARQIHDRASPRPDSHDLTRTLIQHLDGRVARVVVTDLRENVYYALLSIEREGRMLEIDARPSDAIAIALRTDAPIFVRETLLRRLGTPPTEQEVRERPEQAI